MIRACWFTLLCSAFSLQISAQKNIDISIQFGGEQLSCRLYIAATYDSAKHPPLVISLHGFGGDGPEQERYDKLYQVADTAGFLLAYPSGHNNAWNAGADYYAPYTTFDDVGFINALIDSINAIYPIDLSRVYACGMNNGGDMVYRLACELSNRIEAIGSVTGTMITDIYSSCAPQNKMPVIHFHGNADKISNISGGDGWVSLSKTMKLWRGINECVGYTKELLPDTDTKDKSRAWLLASDNCANELNYYLLKNGGHTWPGTPYSIITQLSFGPTNNDVNASIEIWNFFKKFSRPASIKPFTKTKGILQKNIHEVEQ